MLTPSPESAPRNNPCFSRMFARGRLTMGLTQGLTLGLTFASRPAEAVLDELATHVVPRFPALGAW